MENAGQDPAAEPQKDESAAQPTDAAPDSAQPATPAPDEAERASGQPEEAQPEPTDDNPETDTDGEDDGSEPEAQPE